MATINLEGCLKGRHSIAHLLVILFGISAWIGVNGIFVQMPILVRSSPEGSALPTYIVIAIQMANAGPIIYTLLQQRRYKINEPLCILGILTLGNISMAFLIFFYDKTVILSNSEYSMALFILTFFTALVGCFSSVLFMPYLRNYNPTYVISYFIGEGLSGVLPSLVALIQSVGEQMETTNDSNNTSKEIIQNVRFSPPYYFLFIFIILFLALIAFIILQYSSFVKNIKTTFEENKSNQNGKQATYYNIQNKLPSTSNNLYKESEQAMEQVLSNNTINEIRNPKADHEMSLYKKSYLLILMSLLCFFANGFLPSIQLYSCLPYGDITYRLSITLVQFANPIACFIAFWIMPLNLNIINSLSTIILVFCTYVIYVALMSPFVPLRESEIGTIIILVSWTILIGFISYIKLVIVSIFRQIQKPNILFYIGIVMQAGSATGAIVSFTLIQFTNLFQTYHVKMCDEEPSLEQKEDDHSEKDDRQTISLLDLPIEIFLHICSFLDAPTLVHNLCLVCKQFYQILNDDLLWKVRISQIWPKTDYPVLPPAEDDELFWKLSCVAIEKQASLWRNENSMEKLSLTNVQYSTIDGLLLMHDGKICISGARDRSLVCWNLPVEENDHVTYTCRDFAHDGWIWDLTAIDNKVYSCSWDRSIKAWALTPTGLFHFKTYEMIVSGALLCVASCPDLPVFATGSFCKTVLVFDSRAGYSPIARYRPHQRAVIRLAMSSNHILSASEDRTVSIWDLRAEKTMKTITISKESFPMSMSMHKDLIYVGDSSAKLHVLDPKKDFEPVKCYETEHKKGITGVHFTPGCVITSSMDKTVRISSPTDPPQHLTTLTCGYGEIASIDYLNGVLAVSGTEGIEIWRPRIIT